MRARDPGDRMRARCPRRSSLGVLVIDSDPALQRSRWLARDLAPARSRASGRLTRAAVHLEGTPSGHPSPAARRGREGMGTLQTASSQRATVFASRPRWTYALTPVLGRAGPARLARCPSVAPLATRPSRRLPPLVTLAAATRVVVPSRSPRRPWPRSRRCGTLASLGSHASCLTPTLATVAPTGSSRCCRPPRTPATSVTCRRALTWGRATASRSICPSHSIRCTATATTRTLSRRTGCRPTSRT